jgi:hypothetical protein
LRIYVTEASGKHGVTDEQIRFVIRHCGLAFSEPPPDDPAEPHRVLFLGDDERGVALEILAVHDARGGLVAIHAMRTRRRYRRQYEEALEWRIVP